MTTHETFILPENLEEIFKERPDYIIDAIDTVTAKMSPGTEGIGRRDSDYQQHGNRE